jgi:hypothetical protein
MRHGESAHFSGLLLPCSEATVSGLAKKSLGRSLARARQTKQWVLLLQRTLIASLRWAQGLLVACVGPRSRGANKGNNAIVILCEHSARDHDLTHTLGFTLKLMFVSERE